PSSLGRSSSSGRGPGCRRAGRASQSRVPQSTHGWLAALRAAILSSTTTPPCSGRYCTPTPLNAYPPPGDAPTVDFTATLPDDPRFKPGEKGASQNVLSSRKQAT